MGRDQSRLAITVAVVAVLALGLATTGLGIATLHKVDALGAPSGPVPATTIVTPTTGATLSGSELLDVRPINSSVVAVDMLGTGGTLHDTKIGTTSLSLVGWELMWNTTTVANGTYTLVSVGYSGTGQSDRSFSITVTVKN
jgi:hypothetical protein